MFDLLMLGPTSAYYHSIIAKTYFHVLLTTYYPPIWDFGAEDQSRTGLYEGRRTRMSTTMNPIKYVTIFHSVIVYMLMFTYRLFHIL